MSAQLDGEPNGSPNRLMNLARAQRRLALARDHGGEDDLRAARLSLAEAYRFLGRGPEAVALLQPNEDYFLNRATPQQRSRYFDVLSVAHVIAGDTRAALRVRTRQLARLQAQDDVDSITIGRLLNHVAYVSIYAGEIGPAAELIERGIRIGREYPETTILAASLINRSVLYGTDDRARPAIRLLRRVVEDRHLAKTPEQHQQALYSLAHYYRTEGQLDSAVYYTDEILTLVRPETNLSGYFNILTNQAFAYFQLGRKEDFQTTFDTLQAVMARFPNVDARALEGNYSQLMGMESIIEGRPEEGRTMTERAVAVARANTSPTELARSLDAAARAMKDAGFWREAYQYFEELARVNDQLVDATTKQQIAAVESRYASLEKDAQLALQESRLANADDRNRLQLTVILLLLVFSAIVAFVLAQRSRLNKLLLEQKTELEKLDAVKTKFFTNITHELRTPLSLVLAPVERARDLTSSAAVNRQLDLASSNGEKLVNLIDEMLDLSKLESGQMQVHATPIHLQSVLRRLFFAFHSVANLRGVMLSFQYHLPENLWVLVDQPKLEKIIDNLLSNAIKYSNPGGVVTLKAAPQAIGRLRIEVQDTGRGISAAEQARIFDRFYQVAGEGQPLQGGTGIGLALARELALALGGRLDLTSSLGVGSTFALELPLNATKAPGGKQQQSDPEIRITQRPKDTNNRALPYPSVAFQDDRPSLLLVEDNPDMSTFLSDILGGKYRCDTAKDGLEGLKMMEGRDYSLIISDLMMPHLDGFAMRAQMLRENRLRHVPFIFLTARNLSDDRIKGLRLGVDDYLTKPFSPRELAVRVENLLQNGKRREAALREERSTPPKTALTAEETQLSAAERLIETHIADSTFSVDQLAEAMNYSRRQLSRILKKQTGLTPARLIQEVRLQQAYRSLEMRTYHTVAEVANSVGFEDPSYFSKVFVRRFGKAPSEILQAAAADNLT